MKKILLTLGLVVAVGAMGHATSSRIISDRFIHAGNPSFINSYANLKATDLSLRVLSNNILTHAAPAQADEPEWFRAPEITFEYNFSYNNDKRAGGADSDIHGATMGLGWLTYWDISMGALISGNTTDGDGVNALRLDSESVVGTVYLSKSFYDWFFMGLNCSIGGSEVNQRIANVSNSTDIDSYTVAGYVGAYVTEGDWTFSIIPTYSVTMQHYNYRTNNSIDASTSTGTILVTTNIGYNFTEEFLVNVNATPNIIVHDEQTAANLVPADDCWVNFGITGDYQFDETWSMSMNYSYDAFNNDFDNHNANVGTVCRF